jgi:hypothetical protein
MAEGEKMTAIHVGIGDGGEFVYELPQAQVGVETMA